jgi:hypothetical protein
MRDSFSHSDRSKIEQEKAFWENPICEKYDELTSM